jgi:probable F420-dependent oxidoreductase
LSDVRSRIGRLGAWSFRFTDLPIGEVRAAAQRIEELGYSALWYPEVGPGREAVALGALLLAATDRVAVCSGIASIWARDATAAARAAATLNEASDDRFVLGLGVSHAPAVQLRGHAYDRPLTAMRQYLDAMDEVPGERSPRLLAALAPRMLELSRERADGAHTYFVPPEHTSYARARLGAGAVLAVEQAVVLETDATRARELARAHTSRYLRLPNYRNNLLRLGLEERQLDAGGDDDLVDRIVAWGDADAIRARIDEHFAAGADHVAIQPFGDPSSFELDVLEALAPG